MKIPTWEADQQYYLSVRSYFSTQSLKSSENDTAAEDSFCDIPDR